jgi:uncharacterized membrane protein
MALGSFLFLTSAGMGLLMVALGLPMALRWVKPNGLYGFRTPKTLSDETTWYEANAYAGKALALAGLVSGVGGLALFWLSQQPAYAAALNGPLAAVLWLVALFIPLVVCLVVSLAYLQKL